MCEETASIKNNMHEMRENIVSIHTYERMSEVFLREQMHSVKENVLSGSMHGEMEIVSGRNKMGNAQVTSETGDV
jgi:hypothetical protein